MFARLAQLIESFDDLSVYTNNQRIKLNAVENGLMSNVSTNGLGIASNTVIPFGTTDTGYDYHESVINADNITYQNPSVDLTNAAKICNTGNIDDLINTSNNTRVGCGWLYKPPAESSPYPKLSRGYYGNRRGPISITGERIPSYTKWYYDLNEAKKQMHIDKCTSITRCEDLSRDIYNDCGYYNNKGIPIDSNGNALYENDVNCTRDKIIRNKSDCPIPQPNLPGQIIQTDRTCDAVNGRLSTACLQRTVISNGCNDKGALAVALGDNSLQAIDNLRVSDSYKKYNIVASRPLNLDIFKSGQATIDDVLKEVRQLNDNIYQDKSSALGASSRDLCLRKGVYDKYDICSELSDSSQAPFELKCLQRVFLQMSGQPNGSEYPTNDTLRKYNTYFTLGAIKQYWTGLLKDTSSSDYKKQHDAMIKMFGIVPESLSTNIPYYQGVEVFWFVPEYSANQRIVGFLKRTIETDIQQIARATQGQNLGFNQIGTREFTCMLQMMEVRAKTDADVKFVVVVDDGFWIAVNQPARVDDALMRMAYQNITDILSDMRLQGPTMYKSKYNSTYKANKSNITKLFYHDAGGGGQSFEFQAELQSGTNPFDTLNYNLTCEIRAPFLNFQLDKNTNKFEELRNPGLFNQLVSQSGIEIKASANDKLKTPNGKGCITLNSAKSNIHFRSIAYQSWKTLTIAIRFTSSAVNDTIVAMSFGPRPEKYYNIIGKSRNSKTALSIEYNMGIKKNIDTRIELEIKTWYLLIIDNMGNGFDLRCSKIEDIISTNGRTPSSFLARGNGQQYVNNGIWDSLLNNQRHTRFETCSILIGTKGYAGGWSSVYATPLCSYDIGWVHFFDQQASQEDLLRDAKDNWMYSEFPYWKV